MAETILITGANRGIGLEHSVQALAAGQQVIATSRDPNASSLLALGKAHPGRLRIEQLDTGDGASTEALAQRLAGVPIDILINNAGLYGGSWGSDAARQTFASMDYALFGDILNVNVIGPFRVTTALLPNLAVGSRKLVVMMSSDLGSITNNTLGQSHAYRSSKAALNMLTKGLAIDLASQGITIISMAPGWVRTDLGGDAAPWSAEDSIANQRKVIASAGLAQSGQFVNLLGESVAW